MPKKDQPKFKNYISINRDENASIMLSLWCVACPKVRRPAVVVYRGYSLCEQHLLETLQKEQNAKSQPKTEASQA
jgi:hypothetical protein